MDKYEWLADGQCLKNKLSEDLSELKWCEKVFLYPFGQVEAWIHHLPLSLQQICQLTSWISTGRL